MTTYDVIAEITRGCMWHCYKKRFVTPDEAVSFIECTAVGDYEKEISSLGLVTLRFKQSKFICNFDPEEEDPEPAKPIIHSIEDRPVIMPQACGTKIIKSRLISIEELAAEALGRRTYLDCKRLRRELRKRISDHDYRTGWKFDYVTQSDLCEQVRQIARELEHKPRRNRRKKAAPTGRRG